MSRRELLAAGAAGAMLLARPIVARADTAAGSCIWGIGDVYALDANFATYCDQLETLLGRRFAGFRLSGGFKRTSADFTEMHRMISAGRRYTYLNGKPSGTVTGYWQAVAGGVYDSAINTLIKRILADPSWTSTNPLHFSFHHEQYVKAEGGSIAAGTAQDFIAAYRHVRSLVGQANAHVFSRGQHGHVLHPALAPVLPRPVYGIGGGTTAVQPFVVSLCDPGSQYYDMLGVDMYNQAQYSFTAAAQWNPVAAFARAVGRPFLSAETGIAGSDTKVVSCLRDMDALFKSWGCGSGPGQVLGVCWTSRLAPNQKNSDFA